MSFPLPFYPRVETVDERGNEFVEAPPGEAAQGLTVLSSLAEPPRTTRVHHNTFSVASMIAPELDAHIHDRRCQIRAGLSHTSTDNDAAPSPRKTDVVDTIGSQHKRRSLAMDKAITELDSALRELEGLSARADGRIAGGAVPGLFDLLSTRSSAGVPYLALEKFGLTPTRLQDETSRQTLTRELQLKRKQQQLGAAGASLHGATKRLSARCSVNQAAGGDLLALKEQWRVIAPKATAAGATSGRLLSGSDPLFVDCSLETAGGTPATRTNLVLLHPAADTGGAGPTPRLGSAFSVTPPAKAAACTLELTLESRSSISSLQHQQAEFSSSSCTLQAALGHSGSSIATLDASKVLLRLHEGILSQELFLLAKSEAEAAPDQRRLSRGAALASSIATTTSSGAVTASDQLIGGSSAPSGNSETSEGANSHPTSASRAPTAAAAASSDISFAAHPQFSSFLSVLAVTDTMVEIEVDRLHTLRLKLLRSTQEAARNTDKTNNRHGGEKGDGGESSKKASVLMLRAVTLLLDGWASDKKHSMPSDLSDTRAHSSAATATPRPPPPLPPTSSSAAKPVSADSDEMHRKAFAKQYGGLKGPMQRKRLPAGPSVGQNKSEAPSQQQQPQQHKHHRQHEGGAAISGIKEVATGARVWGVLRPLAAVARHDLLLDDLKGMCVAEKWILDGPLGQPNWETKVSSHVLHPCPPNIASASSSSSSSVASEVPPIGGHVQVVVNGESGRFEVDLRAWGKPHDAHRAESLQMSNVELHALLGSL